MCEKSGISETEKRKAGRMRLGINRDEAPQQCSKPSGQFAVPFPSIRQVRCTPTLLSPAFTQGALRMICSPRFDLFHLSRVPAVWWAARHCLSRFLYFPTVSANARKTSGGCPRMYACIHDQCHPDFHYVFTGHGRRECRSNTLCIITRKTNGITPRRMCQHLRAMWGIRANSGNVACMSEINRRSISGKYRTNRGGFVPWQETTR